MPKQLLVEGLPQRPSQKTNKFKPSGGFSTSLESTQVSVSTNLTGGKYSAPTLEGSEFDRMRRYGLILGRWSLPNIDKEAKKTTIPVSCYEAANRLVANDMFKNIFGDDPTQGTVNLTPYINAFNAGHITPELIHSVAGFIGTEAYSTIVKLIKSSPKSAQIKRALTEMSNSIQTNVFDDKPYYEYGLNALHERGRYAKNRAIGLFSYIASIIASSSNSLMEEVSDKPQPKSTKKLGEKPDKPTRLKMLPEESGWCKPYLAKYPLELPHTGKMGRRNIFTNEGKYPKHFHRQVTDPFRRIFSRKTRSLGGVVVFDCSGSMGLSEEQVQQVLRSSAGCSIVCYSDHGDEDKDREFGNIHLIARNGRQMRGLPEFPGGNGVDLPALRYGYDHLRLNGKSPVIWVSDGQVTGLTGTHSSVLWRKTEAYIKRRNIHHVQTPEEAVKLLNKLQRGIRK